MRRLVAVALVLALPSCAVGVRRAKPSPSGVPLPSITASPPACRATYAPPDPKRPVVRLTFALDAAHTTVAGTEHVVFTPDRAITELVFRLWLNGPGPEKTHGRIDVTHASLPMRTEPGGGSAGRPTFLRLALPKPVAKGQRVTADLSYVIRLPDADTDRWGHTSQTAWWASAHPLLAWVRGEGWVTDDAVSLLGETAVSEVADYDVDVTAPAGDTVLGNAFTSDPVDVPAGRRWHFHNDKARDVAVAVGQFALRHSTIAGVPVVVGVSDEVATGSDAERTFGPVMAGLTDALPVFRSRFGVFPFDTLTVVAIEHIHGSGVEYPGLVMVGSRRYDVVVPHEVAHQWFYGLIGDDQARDPWLDEAFATYGEAQVDPDSADSYLDALDAGGEVGRPMSYWAKHGDDYGKVVYAKGAAALLTARAAGPALFDALLRCYVAENAYRVVTPLDLVEALAPMPQAVRVLGEAGALIDR
jgi:aminopeptidase N